MTEKCGTCFTIAVGATAQTDGPARPTLLPSRPKGKTPDCVIGAISKLKQNYQMANESLNKKKTRNPSILEKLVDHLGINETGTNCDTGVFDPDRWGEADYGEALCTFVRGVRCTAGASWCLEIFSDDFVRKED